MKRVFFTTDLHGSEICFKKFIKAAEFYQADILIMGGDATGKMVVPIIENKRGFISYYLGKEQFIGKEKMQEYEINVKNAGYYPIFLSIEEYNELCNDKNKIEELFKKLMIQTMERWMSMAEEQLADNVRCIITPGNDDAFEIDEVIKKSNRVIYGENRIVEIDEHHELLSLGWSNTTPWDTPRECSEDDLREKIEKLAIQVKNMKNCVFNLHAPPYGSGLDVAPELGDGNRVVRGGYVKKSVGSHAVAEAIKKYQPLASIHGHIHESKAIQKIGRTLCINPGSMYGDSVLCGAIIDLLPDKIKNYATTTG